MAAAVISSHQCGYLCKSCTRLVQPQIHHEWEAAFQPHPLLRSYWLLILGGERFIPFYLHSECEATSRLPMLHWIDSLTPMQVQTALFKLSRQSYFGGQRKKRAEVMGGEYCQEVYGELEERNKGWIRSYFIVSYMTFLRIKKR